MARLYAQHVRLNRGGYDRNGRYFGVGQTLYRVFDDEDIDVYVRAPNAKAARDCVRQKGQATAQYHGCGYDDDRTRGGGVLFTRPRNVSRLGAPPQQAHCANNMRLVYLPPNQAWAFKYGDSLLQMHGWPMLLSTRAQAIAAARSRGLTVDRHGCVHTAEAREAV